MTNDELEAVRARAEAATPGPWEWRWDAILGQWSLAPGVLLADGTDGTPGGDKIDVENAEFIAHARTDIPALLDEVERLREGHEIVARIWKILGSPTFEELRGDTIYDVIEKRLSCATRAEARAERLAKGLEALANGLETIMPFAKDGMDFSLAHTLVDQARAALSSYRGVKDEA